MSLANPYYVGLQNVGSYQVSGVPFVTGATAPVSSSTPVEIVFPEVTQRIIVANTGLADLRVGFSANGVKNTNNYFVVHQHDATVSAHYETIDLRVKVSSIFLLSNSGTVTTSARIAAELTNIDTMLLNNSGPSGSNWSGSVGVG
jgi:hypothetical protein